MRRFLRILFAALAGVSLIMCVAAAGAWVRSLFWTDYLTAVGGHSFYVLSTRQTSMVAGRLNADVSPYFAERNGVQWRAEKASFVDRSGRQSPWSAPRDSIVPGIAFVAASARLPDRRLIVVNLAYVSAAFAIVPVGWFVGLRRRRREVARTLAELCATCGYDLRASPGRCPECGAVPAPAGTHAAP